MKGFLPYVGPVIGLTGLTLALYFHAQSIQERSPTFYVSPQRAVIVDARRPTSSDLQILYRGKLVATSVTTVTVYLWNEGRMPIRANDVLGGPVAIELAAGAEILEVRVLKVSRPVIQFSQAGVSDKAKNQLPVSFDILEQHDGAAIQLTYSGDPSA